MGLSTAFDVIGDINTLWSAKSHVESTADGNGHPVSNTMALASDTLGVAQMLIPRAAPTPVISAGLLAVAAMNLQCGIGAPDSGDRFANGNNEFNTLGQMLESAVPKDQWQGGASNAYAAQDSRQQERSDLMAKADSTIAAAVQKQAQQVTNTRTILDACSVAMGLMIAPAMAAYPLVPAGPAISMSIQIGAVAGSLPIAQASMVKMGVDAMMNASQITQAANLYKQAAATARS